MKPKRIKESKSFLIEPELMAKAKDLAKDQGISINEFIRLSIKERIYDGSSRLENLVRHLEEAITNLKKQTIQVQVGILEEAQSLSETIKKASNESIHAQEEMTKAVVMMLANQVQSSSAEGSTAPPNPPNKPAQRKAGPDFSNF